MCKFVLILFFGIGAVLSNPFQSRILNGHNALPGQFPWMVSLRSVETSEHFCGGALETPEHVVTAAHCILWTKPEEIYVVSGHIDNWEGGRNTAVSELRIHPQYLLVPHSGYDIAVMKLATPVPYTAFELPIPIASKDPGVYPCVLSGWGRAYTMTRETCIKSWHPTMITEAVLCAGGVMGEGACFGDSGSPLVCDGVLSGTVVTGDPCGNGKADVYANVFYHLEWILKNIADLSP